MAEVAVNVPFDSNEAKDILCQEFRKILDGLGPLHGAKEYSQFTCRFQGDITLWRAGEGSTPKKTLAWGSTTRGAAAADDVTETAIFDTEFKSGDPNQERMDRDMLMTLETKDARGGVVRRKGRISE